MAYVVVTISGRESCRRPLRGELTVGRSSECDVWVNDGGVSRLHCRIEPTPGGGWAVSDHDSRNGTYVQHERVAYRALRDGDVVTIGPAKVTFHEVGFVAERPAAPEPRSAVDSMSATIVTPPKDAKLPLATHATVMKPEAATADNGVPKKDSSKPRSLPFARPPAKPQVDPDKAAGQLGDDDDSERQRSHGLLRRWRRK